MIKYLDEDVPFQQLFHRGELQKKWKPVPKEAVESSNVQFLCRRWSSLQTLFVWLLLVQSGKTDHLGQLQNVGIVVCIFFSLGHSLGSYLRRNLLSDFPDRICNGPFSSRNIISDRSRSNGIWRCLVIDFGFSLSNSLKRRRIHVIRRMWDFSDGRSFLLGRQQRKGCFLASIVWKEQLISAGLGAAVVKVDTSFAKKIQL